MLVQSFPNLKPEVREGLHRTWLQDAGVEPSASVETETVLRTEQDIRRFLGARA